MRNLEFMLFAAVVVPLVAIAQGGAAPAAPQRAGATAMVKLQTAKGEPAGQAVLTAVPDGVEIVLNVEKLTPGLHGFHIHTNGSCAPGPDPSGKTIDFGAAGGHFDPAATARHGHPEHDAQRHAGDAPNLTADAQGKATLRYTNTMVTLVPGKTSVIGKALVVHADADDYKTNPAGNSGARVLCGVIEPARDAVVGSVAR
ncbi:superoxide dismutase family protein [Pseudorhodoferax sp. Leaf267]|uniref:superoxide dismutase family protein n=1 Tax=Pseudorhodoferax sp. Leaf267 TaxID=1736316 RepID=UPI0006FBFEAD|nr:superoxide dismutase family protein [Pseudorhodoferax sp. Leaf267]KQP23063.1 hypothetical protein ASF43_04045 [Pseudorhodoferax sp. Leaf267]